MVTQARQNLVELLGTDNLTGKTFLDIGFGQGLSLCLAADMGADATGLDIDTDNLDALQVTAKQVGLASPPPVQIGSILDKNLVERLNFQKHFDIVHSWGVLHHTGDMKTAIKNTAAMVKPGGLLAIAIYNKHWSSTIWVIIKKIYNVSPPPIRRLIIMVFYVIIYIAKFIVTGKNPKSKKRGMDFYHDVVDWVGGYPYEYASASQVISYIENLGFAKTSFHPAGVPTGCNEFVFIATE